MNTKQFVDATNQEVDPENAGYALEAGHAKSADTAKNSDAATKAGTADKASKADKLSATRKIAGHAFDGTQDVPITASDVGAYNKKETDDKFAVSTANVTKSGIGFSIERQSKGVTMGITGITTEKFSNGWHTLGTIPSGYRPRSTRTCQLALMVGNTLMRDAGATITIETNGTIRLRCYGMEKSWEVGGNMAWITT